MFAQLFLAMALMGSGSQPSGQCPITPSDHGLVWHQVTRVSGPAMQVTWTVSQRESRSVGQAVAAMHDVEARPATYQEMVARVCESWNIFRGHHIVALNSYAVRPTGEVIVQAITARGRNVLEPLTTVWRPGTVFIMVNGPARALPILDTSTA